MTRQPTVQIRSRLGMLAKYYRWWLGLAFLIALAALVAYLVAPAPAVASPAAVAAQAAAPDPAMQSVLAYLRAHSGSQPAPTPAMRLDPAQQSVMRYVRAHQPTEQPASLWEQVRQTLRGYLGRNNQ